MVTLEELSDFGRGLISDEASEIALRTAAGRLYYVAYHLCKRAADLYCNEPPEEALRKKGMHERTYIRLQAYCHHQGISNRRLALICEKAKEMRAIRTQADYQLDGDFTYNDAREMQQLLFMLRREFNEVYREVVHHDGKAAPQ